MVNAANDVVITGVGLVTCQGVGIEPHIEILAGKTAPAAKIDVERFSPYPVHPLPEIDWSLQIPEAR